jgi:outer membrane receptor protein involved in Fe transport
MIRHRWLVESAVAAMALGLASSAALAQDAAAATATPAAPSTQPAAAAPGSALGEIVVTATRRATNL